MKKCQIYLFTGTGNTLRVAEYYKQYLSKEYDVSIYQVRYPLNTVPNPNEAELIGFGYPIHAFNTPKVFIKFVKALPAITEAVPRKTFIFETSGEGLHANDASSDMLKSILHRKQYDVLTDRHFVMPYNMIGRTGDAMVKQMIVYAHALARVNSTEILAGKKERTKFHPWLNVWSAIFRVEWMYAELQGPHMKVNEGKCIRCMKCVRDCPLANITVDHGTIRMGRNCALCVRCSFSCPTKAISIGLLENWKVNGPYDVARVMSDETIPFPFITKKTKGIYSVYKKYYQEIDAYFLKRGVKILSEDYVSK